MAFVSRDLMVNVLYGMAGEADKLGCTPSPDKPCTPSPGDGCTPSPPNCPPTGDEPDCTPSPITGDEGYKARPPRQGLASLRQQLRETLAQA
jgi:hypothetical protein